jgi:hypothetical protein|tara:strand:- start:1387 stop:1596 length:210 start_codon:yes stop_codon:yes gene_type:complete
MNEFEKSVKIDWSLHATIAQPYRTQPLLWEFCNAMAVIETQNQLEESIQQMEEFPDAQNMLTEIGIMCK